MEKQTYESKDHFLMIDPHSLDRPDVTRAAEPRAIRATIPLNTVNTLFSPAVSVSKVMLL